VRESIGAIASQIFSLAFIVALATVVATFAPSG
jgi:hypothetical protein